ncbi:MerR family transcriptional regulator [Parasporobacterium paucivorans]|uniref:DNA-binding transcriptional regulator, MerR family n=1 Tax=Parasporobacterium paucivorans DSM 15970 TaxID=1122934 RepID=A0A1M6E5C9_9FIRM|nr:MerR family transcriptional regulator [Parasporobacterium paucivorans]SHI80603.1 DNA-binding transcriptional regulator, MerR family [Parasporobacterium paucivorans DSM 15970]
MPAFTNRVSSRDSKSVNPEEPQNVKELPEKAKYTISEMARINGISRQTLIYYDKNRIFQPDLVGENGYRYYSPQSIPFLREICFLKSIGISLKDINSHVYTRNFDSAIDFLTVQKADLENEILDLRKKCASLTNRLNVYKKAGIYKDTALKPFIEHFPERKICFFPWNTTDMNRTVLHLALMQAWTELERYGLYVENGWGAMLHSRNLASGDLIREAGGYANLPLDCEVDEGMEGIITIPEGDFACMSKYGMPYEIKYIYYLVDWIEKNDYEIIGDIYDECFLDQTFYDKDYEVDFCQIQIPIRKKNS